MTGGGPPWAGEPGGPLCRAPRSMPPATAVTQGPAVSSPFSDSGPLAAAFRPRRTSAAPQTEPGRSSGWAELLAEVEALNVEGARCSRQGKAAEALRSLTEAQVRLDSMEPCAGAAEVRHAFLSAQADTASNLGIYHRKEGAHELAIRHLQRALKLHKATGAHPRTLVAAHLNMAVCHLESGAAPMESLRHAKAAVELGGQLLAASPAQEAAGVEPPADDCAMLAVAYHKVAEAHEASREWAKASHAYTQAYEVVRRSLGASHHLTRAFEKSSRCPHYAVATPSFQSTVVCGTPRRLPSIPRSRPSTRYAETRVKYELNPDIFAPWPPRSASSMEHAWYGMVPKR